MIFLIGSRRSGTNWLFQNLIRHPEIVGIPAETYLFPLGMKPLRERFHHGSPGSLQTGTLYMAREAMLDAFRDLADKAFAGVAERLDPAADRVLERTPWNANHLDLLGDVYPDAYYIHIIRDGRDVAGSLVRKWFGPNSIREAAEEWRSAIENARAAAPSRYMEVRYEALVSDPVSQLTTLFEWLGLACEESMVEDIALQAAKPVYLLPNARVEEGKWRSTLSAGDLRTFNDVAGSLNRELGYPELSVAPSTVTDRARDRLRRVAASVRHRSGRAVPAQPAGPSLRHEGATIADTLIAAAESGNVDSLRGLFDPDAAIIVEDGVQRQEATGAEGLGLLRTALGAFALPGNRRLRSEVYNYVSGVAVVLSQEAGAGRPLDTVMLATLQATSPVTITQFAYYRTAPDVHTHKGGSPSAE